MRNINKETLEALRKKYPQGATVELVKMEDAQAPPVGTRGKVLNVDDIGTIHVKWKSGQTLGVVYGEDECRIVCTRHTRICPKCGRTYTQPPAISRVDNATPICPDCGILEALDTIGLSEKEKKDILEIVHEHE